MPTFRDALLSLVEFADRDLNAAKAAILDDLLVRTRALLAETAADLPPAAAPMTASPVVEQAPVEAAAPAALPESPADDADALPPAAPVRRGRGRPRKSAAPEAEAPPADEPQADEAPAAAEEASDAPTTVEDLYGSGDDFLDGIV